MNACMFERMSLYTCIHAHNVGGSTFSFPAVGVEVAGQLMESVILIHLYVSSRHGNWVTKLAQPTTLLTVKFTPLTT